MNNSEKNKRCLYDSKCSVLSSYNVVITHLRGLAFAVFPVASNTILLFNIIVLVFLSSPKPAVPVDAPIEPPSWLLGAQPFGICHNAEAWLGRFANRTRLRSAIKTALVQNIALLATTMLSIKRLARLAPLSLLSVMAAPVKAGVVVSADFDRSPVFHRGTLRGQNPVEPRYSASQSWYEQYDGSD